MKIRLTILFLLVSFVFIGCGVNKSSSNESVNQDMAYNETGGEGFNQVESGVTENSESLEDSDATLGEERKIIKKAELQMETLEFDNALSKLESGVKSIDGYIESSNIYQGGIVNNSKVYKNANYVIRVPKDKLDIFLSDVGDIGKITNKNISGEDVSSTYFDKESRLKVLKAQEERYIELVAQAKDVKEILEIETYLTDVRTEIESITGYLTKIDSLIDYSTVTIYIQEVDEESIEEPDSFGGKIIKTFKGSSESLQTLGSVMILSLIAVSPYALILAILCFVVYKIYKKRKNGKV